MKSGMKQTVLGDVLRKWRVMSDIDQRTAAKRMGISAATLCRLENGETTPDAHTLLALLTWLLKGVA